MGNENQAPVKRAPNAGLLLLIGLLAVGAGLLAFNLDLLIGRRGSEPATRATQSATVIAAPRALQPFSLTDHLGNPFTEATLHNQWTILSFGYTHCPDVCPTALATLARFDDRLKQNGTDIPYRVVFVSIDPQRDTRERLAEYVPYFNPSFIGATGDVGELEKLTRQLGILYARVDNADSAMGYLMDHSASFVLTDPQGRYRAVFGAPHDDQVMAHDFRLITADSGD